MIIVITASGTLRRHGLERRGGRGKYIDMRNACAWAAALLSTFGLPWSGVPFSHYAGARSWTWFLFAFVSLVILRGDGRLGCGFRRCFALLNPAAIMTAIYAFMYSNGVPGDIPGIEAVAAVNTLEGLMGGRLRLAWVFFLVSATASFLPVYSPNERAPALLSFSYSSFLAIAFLPPARMLFTGLSPEIAIQADAAASFVCAFLIHTFIMGSLSGLAASHWRYSHAAVNAALTAAGMFFLFAVGT